MINGRTERTEVERRLHDAVPGGCGYELPGALQDFYAVTGQTV